MESSVMVIRNSVMVAGTMIIVIGGLVLFLLRGKPLVDKNYQGASKSPRGGKIYYGVTNGGERFVCRFCPPVRVPLTFEQSNEVVSVYGRISFSYERGELREMRKWINAMPDVVTNMPDRVFAILSQPVSNALLNGFLNPDHMMDFASVKDFDEYVRCGMELTIFWGNTFLRRGDYEGPVAFIDTSVLRQLLSYKRKFHSEGLYDFEENADVHIDEWRRQIECEMGFTRQFMWYQVDLQWRNYKEGTWTVDQLSGWAKRYAKGLIQLGYTPKWLSEFDDLSEAVK